MKHRNENWPAQFPGRMSQEATKPWCAIAPHLAPNQTFWVRPCLTQNFNQIYAYDCNYALRQRLAVKIILHRIQ